MSSSSEDRRLRVGLVVEPAGIEDPFSRGAYVGMERAVRELGVEGRVLTPAPREGSTPSLSWLAERRYDLVIGTGEFMTAAVDAAAARFPKIRFAILGAAHESLAHRPPNAQGLVFAEHEVGFLAGFLAGLAAALTPGEQRIGAVGGMKVGSVERFIAGYVAGARRASPEVTVLTAYTDDFLDPAKGRSVALDLIAKGALVLFQVANACGLGVLEAAGEQGVWGIGVDVDQSSLGPHVLASAVKRLDVAVFSAVRELVEGSFRTGGDTTFDLRSGGVALGAISPMAPPGIGAEVERLEADLRAGRVTVEL